MTVQPSCRRTRMRRLDRNGFSARRCEVLVGAGQIRTEGGAESQTLGRGADQPDFGNRRGVPVLLDAARREQQIADLRLAQQIRSAQYVEPRNRS